MHQISIDHLRFQMRTGGTVFKASTLVALNVTQQSDRFKRILKDNSMLSQRMNLRHAKNEQNFFNFQGQRRILKAGRI